MGAIGAAGTMLAFIAVLTLGERVPYPSYFQMSAVFIFAGRLMPSADVSGFHIADRPRLLYRRNIGFTTA